MKLLEFFRSKQWIINFRREDLMSYSTEKLNKQYAVSCQSLWRQPIYESSNEETDWFTMLFQQFLIYQTHHQNSHLNDNFQSTILYPAKPRLCWKFIQHNSLVWRLQRQSRCWTVESSFKYVVADKLFVQSDASNCKVGNDKILLDVSNIAMAKYVQSVPTSAEKPADVGIAVIAPPPLSNAKQNVVVYMTGYLLLKVPVSDCDECSEQLILPRLPPPSQEMSFYTFVHEKNLQRRRFFGPSNIDNGQLCWTSWNYVLCNFWRHNTHVICVK